MKELLFFVLLAAMFASCAGEPDSLVLSPSGTGETAEAADPYIVTDYKNKAAGESMPEWANGYYNGGVKEIEAMDAYEGRYIFVYRNEGTVFNALTQWTIGFDTELDFPRMAAARIETRLSSGIPFPDNEYGAFYETLIRAAADASWAGAVREDDFWIRREFTAREGEDELLTGQAADGGNLPARENWEFLILVSVEKNIFASRLQEIFGTIKPNPPLSRNQAEAVSEVKELFFEGF